MITGVAFCPQAPALVPEVANTLTAGFVYRPEWLRNFTLAVDWYRIRIANAITSISGTDPTVQNICINSGGTSPFCDFYVGRPLGPTNRDPSNIPQLILSQPFNTAYNKTTGVDAELTYHTEAPTIIGDRGGFDLRALVSYQPSLKRQTLPGAVITDAAGATGLAEWRVNVTLGYTSGPLQMSVMERWHSKENQSADPTLVFTQGPIPAIAYTDLSFSYRFGGSGTEKPLQLFLNIENVFNKQPTLALGPGLATSPGFSYPAPLDQDVIGRYFTAGVRARF